MLYLYLLAKGVENLAFSHPAGGLTNWEIEDWEMWIKSVKHMSPFDQEIISRKWLKNKQTNRSSVEDVWMQISIAMLFITLKIWKLLKYS